MSKCDWRRGVLPLRQFLYFVIVKLLGHCRDGTLNAVHEPVHTNGAGGATGHTKSLDHAGIDALQVFVGQGNAGGQNGQDSDVPQPHTLQPTIIRGA